MDAGGALIPLSKPKIKVLVVDDSAIVRKILSEAINSQPDMEVIATAPDPFVARDKILALQPDVLTLDIEMPRMDGLTFLKKVMRFHPVPTIVISSLGQASTTAALDALRFGAFDILAKPSGPYSVGELRNSLPARIRAAACTPRIPPPDRERPTPAAEPERAVVPSVSGYATGTILAIGASTGGTVAIQHILSRLPADIPGTVITQHIPAGFSEAFAKRLNQCCSMEVREAVQGDNLHPGLALLAPGDFHMLLRRSGSHYSVELQQGPQVCYQRPSVDVMFASVAQAAGAHAVGVLLTGMGTDGAKGLLAMRQAKARTLAQDESTCTVYGMPREAVRLGAVDRVVALDDFAGVIGETLRPAREANGNHNAPGTTRPQNTLQTKGATQ
jgi:two-component system chemotaxis response regulator CheB